MQTSPLWIAIGLSVRRSGWIQWTALPCFFFWLTRMILIWLFFFAWDRIVSGSFSPTEIAMTVIVGLAIANPRKAACEFPWKLDNRKPGNLFLRLPRRLGLDPVRLNEDEAFQSEP